jgi:hypothetical protein
VLDTHFSTPLHATYAEELYCYNVIVKIDVQNGFIYLQNGSNWHVADPDSVELLSWRVNDYSVITPNHYSSDYAFYITNQSNGSYVRVNVVDGPRIGGLYTTLIAGMDLSTNFRRSVYLNNNSYWSIDSSDFTITDNWQVGDPIIMGRNDQWFTSYATILINITTNTWVRARKL